MAVVQRDTAVALAEGAAVGMERTGHNKIWRWIRCHNEGKRRSNVNSWVSSSSNGVDGSAVFIEMIRSAG